MARSPGQELAEAARSVRAWPLRDQRAMSTLTPEQLRQSAADMEHGPDTPHARRQLANAMEFTGMTEASPRKLIELWEMIREANVPQIDPKGQEA